VRAPKIQKPSVARVIVRAIRNGDPPGRFLRKDEKLGKWVDIGDKKAAEKTSQALREKTPDEKEMPISRDLLSQGAQIFLPSPSSYLASVAATPPVLPGGQGPSTVTVVPSVKAEEDDREADDKMTEEDRDAEQQALSMTDV
jgi:hypothetical protein